MSVEPDVYGSIFFSFYKGVKNYYVFLTAIITVAFITCDTMLRIIHCRHRERGDKNNCVYVNREEKASHVPG